LKQRKRISISAADIHIELQLSEQFKSHQRCETFADLVERLKIAFFLSLSPRAIEQSTHWEIIDIDI
jgi:hypothetical protein